MTLPTVLDPAQYSDNFEISGCARLICTLHCMICLLKIKSYQRLPKLTVNATILAIQYFLFFYKHFFVLTCAFLIKC